MTVKSSVVWVIKPCNSENSKVLEEHITSILMVEEKAKRETGMKQAASRAGLRLNSEGRGIMFLHSNDLTTQMTVHNS
jgi:hypothetical protein